jgi:hypothetical protein
LLEKGLALLDAPNSWMKQIRESYEGHAALHGTEQVPILSFPNIRPHV